jgi:hypothetical protein
MKIADVLEDIREKYKQHTGQSMQKKATPIREGVVVIEDGTTLRQLQDFAERIEERFGIHTFQIYTHKDEGANVWDGNTEAWKPNYHAHMIFDWTDGETGRTRKLNKQNMAEMQTILAECLGMERGISSDRKHLSAIQYKNMVEAEKVAQIEKECLFYPFPDRLPRFTAIYLYIFKHVFRHSNSACLYIIHISIY